MLYEVVRFNPKGFAQRRADGAWSMQGVRRVLYRLASLKGQSIVYIVEGEKDADRLQSIGLPATTAPGGAGKWRDDYVKQLTGSGVGQIVVLADNDFPGRKHADTVARSCQVAGLTVKVAPLPGLQPKGDVSDWLDSGHTREDLRAVIDSTTVYSTPVDETNSQPSTALQQPARISQATRLVDFARAAGVELWRSPTGDPYITLPVDEHREHHRLKATAVRDWLARLYYVQTRTTPSTQAIAEGLAVLAGMARYEGVEHETAVRVGGAKDRVYLDLGNSIWSAVEVTPDGWKIVADTSVRFIRSRGMLSLPEPTQGGSVSALRELIHVASDDDYRLLVAWLLGALCPTGPYPLLSLVGEQGAGKSTAARLIRQIIDPHIADLRAEPRTIDDIMIAAARSRIVALDNLSSLPPWLSDALSRLSTGGALSKRELYSDDDETIIQAERPTILTSIADVVTRGDLLDRAIVLTLPAFPEPARLPEALLRQRFDQVRAAMLGALLDGIALSLRSGPELPVPSLPRMADWAVWVTAAEPAFGWRDGATLDAYRAMRGAAVETTLDGDPMALAIRGLTFPWEGTAADLLNQVTRPGRSPRGWPETPRAMSAALRRLSPGLRRVGIEVSTSREAGTGGRRLIALRAHGNEQS